MEDLADLLSDDNTVLRGYIAVTSAKIVGHMCVGKDRTLPLAFNHNQKGHEPDQVLWCYVEKERGQAPKIFPVVQKPGQDELDALKP